MLLTRYAPLRRSPASGIATKPAAPRLACVRPAASVHPEPGSNSSLYILSLLLDPTVPRIYRSVDGLFKPLTFHSNTTLIFKELSFGALSVQAFISQTGCKDMRHFFIYQIFSSFFLKNFHLFFIHLIIRHKKLATNLSHLACFISNFAGKQHFYEKEEHLS